MALTIIVVIVQKGKKLIGLGAECLASLFSQEHHSKDPPLPRKQVQYGKAQKSGDKGPRVRGSSEVPLLLWQVLM